VQNNEPDRIADLLEEAADALEPRELSDDEIITKYRELMARNSI
jgi:DNA/RNA-binding domain of Phe-tRNA-synthetase-like protein